MSPPGHTALDVLGRTSRGLSQMYPPLKAVIRPLRRPDPAAQRLPRLLRRCRCRLPAELAAFLTRCLDPVVEVRCQVDQGDAFG